jgi:IclR family pca regulon transcriptional regulator
MPRRTESEPVEQEDNRNYVTSFSRGLEVIRAFDRTRPSMTLTQVADLAGLNRAAARRFLLTLVRDGYAETDGKYYRLRPKILGLGFSALSSMTFSEIAQPFMDELAGTIDEMCLAAVLDGEWVVYVNRTVSHRLLSLNIEVGTRLPAFCMSTGRVLLSALPEAELEHWLARFKPVRYTKNTIVSKRRLKEAIVQAREDGWAVMDEEYEEGFRSLSVPIADRTGATVAALNICCPSHRVSLETMKTDFLRRALETAARIRESLPEEYLRNGVRNGSA